MDKYKNYTIYIHSAGVYAIIQMYIYTDIGRDIYMYIYINTQTYVYMYTNIYVSI